MDHTEGRIRHIETIALAILADVKKHASPEFREVLEHIPIRVLWDSEEGDKYGDFFGVPLDMGDGSDAAPADIILYARPLWDECNGDDTELHHQTRITLMHEIGHYLGLDHAELKERGWM